MFESNGFEHEEIDFAIEQRKTNILNRHLTKVEMEIYLAIKYGDPHKLKDLGASEQIDLNFKIEIEKGLWYYPIQLASALGMPEVLEEILNNRMLQIDVIDEKTGTNSFWLAAFYGRGLCMGMLAQAGINIFNTHKVTKSNALHVAIERKHYECATMLISSKYPLNEIKEGGLTALIISARDKSAVNVSESMLKKGAKIDLMTNLGQTALS